MPNCGSISSELRAPSFNARPTIPLGGSRACPAAMLLDGSLAALRPYYDEQGIIDVARPPTGQLEPAGRCNIGTQ